MKTFLKCAMLAIVSWLLTACSLTPSSDQIKVKTRVVDSSLQNFKPLRMSARDTCATQRAIAEHNSVYETLRTKKVAAFCPPCGCPKKHKVAPKTKAKPKKEEPKTS